MQFLLNTPVMRCCGQSPDGSCAADSQAAAAASARPSGQSALASDASAQAVWTTCPAGACTYRPVTQLSYVSPHAPSGRCTDARKAQPHRRASPYVPLPPAAAAPLASAPPPSAAAAGRVTPAATSASIAKNAAYVKHTPHEPYHDPSGRCVLTTNATPAAMAAATSAARYVAASGPATSAGAARYASSAVTAADVHSTYG